MDFTNKYISKTYNNVMTNDGFSSDKPTYIKSNEFTTVFNNLKKLNNGYTSIYDGVGQKANLDLSISNESEVDGNPYPYSRYTTKNKYFYIPGDKLNSGQALIFNKLSGGNTLSSTNKVIFGDEYITLGKTKWPYKEAPNKSILTISDNQIGFDENIYNTLVNRREKFAVINRSQTASSSNAGSYTINFDLRNYMNLTNATTAFIRIKSEATGNPTGRGVSTWLKLPGMNRVTTNYMYKDGEKFTTIPVSYGVPISQETSSTGDGNSRNSIDMMLMLPIIPNDTNIQIYQIHNNGRPVAGMTYTTAGYKTFVDSQTTTIVLLGAMYTNNEN